jgi:LmbE family N-acetylglucosaminyl deacetylase
MNPDELALFIAVYSAAYGAHPDHDHAFEAACAAVHRFRRGPLP